MCLSLTCPFCALPLCVYMDNTAYHALPLSICWLDPLCMQDLRVDGISIKAFDKQDDK